MASGWAKGKGRGLMASCNLAMGMMSGVVERSSATPLKVRPIRAGRVLAAAGGRPLKTR
jgi:hypothetical protein